MVPVPARIGDQGRPLAQHLGHRQLILDINTVAGAPKKIEGVALVDINTIVLINDNDFGMTDGPAAFDASGRLVDSGLQTTLVYVDLNV